MVSADEKASDIRLESSQMLLTEHGVDVRKLFPIFDRIDLVPQQGQSYVR